MGVPQGGIQEIDRLLGEIRFLDQCGYFVAEFVRLKHPDDRAWDRVRVGLLVELNSSSEVYSLYLLSNHSNGLFLSTFASYREPFFNVDRHR